ncbi:hypothetical protein RA280_02505 [Cupriavidus sp. CV2]|uniref:hypothetical protein n=1 Tax=Cupriavidus ulmosensis TaxID=3065913 RepID=UPI00296A93B9|nr:hypothetical protein [Cupriavidus sp. CV2]MDW3680636.1 hypothetical protein [Cupriavidus sp. CV2]
MARWYGPYYTESGTVYRPDGTQTRRDMSSGVARPMGVYDSNGNLARVSQAPGTPHATMVEEATLSRSSLGRGGSGGMSMRSAAVSRAPAVSSRGGFASRLAGLAAPAAAKAASHFFRFDSHPVQPSQEPT